METLININSRKMVYSIFTQEKDLSFETVKQIAKQNSKKVWYMYNDFMSEENGRLILENVYSH